MQQRPSSSIPKNQKGAKGKRRSTPKRNKSRRVEQALLPSVSSSSRTNIASMKNIKGGVTISHSETIATVTNGATANFLLVGKTNGWAINPGSVYTFPWLSTIARNYEKYRFRHLRFDLVTSAPVTHSGQVFMCLDTDTTDDAPTEETEMLQMRYACVKPVYQSLDLTLGSADCVALHEPMKRAYVKEFTGEDDWPRSSTIGRLFVAMLAPQASTLRLSVSYTIELTDPQNNKKDVAYRSSGTHSLGLTTITDGLKVFGDVAESAPWKLITSVAAALLPVSAIDINTVGRWLDVSGSLVDNAGVVAGTVIGKGIGTYLLDSAGALLAEVSPSSGAVAGKYNYMDSKTGFDTPASALYSNAQGGTMSFNTDLMRYLYPAVRWIVPYMIAGTAASGGPFRKRFSVKTEL